MNRGRFVVVLGACAMQASCGTWVNHSNPNANYQADYYDCEMQAARAFPVQMQTTTSPSVTNTNCTGYGNSATCTSTTSPGQTYNSGGDVNLGNRIGATFSCMGAKGWSLESESHAAAPSRASSEIKQSRVATSKADQETRERSAANRNFYCVRPSASLGDVLPMDDEGRTSRVRETFGSSERCPDPEYPVLADITTPSYTNGTCAGAQVQVGDTLTFANGKLVKVTKLYSTSSACTDPELPQLVSVVPE
jgi:hypothetical protein